MQPSPTSAPIGNMIPGYWVSQAFYAAAKFGIANSPKDGATSADELAQQTEAQSDLS